MLPPLITYCEAQEESGNDRDDDSIPPLVTRNPSTYDEDSSILLSKVTRMKALYHQALTKSAPTGPGQIVGLQIVEPHVI